MGKIKPSRTSNERMRWNAEEGTVMQGPGEGGNEFDVVMAEHRNGPACIRQIVRIMKERGICTVEANAPMDMLNAAYEEAENLSKNNAFGPAFQVFDEYSRTDAQIFGPSMPDEDKTYWLRDKEKTSYPTTALNALQRNMSDFATSIMDRIRQELGVKYDCYWNAMVSCYSGDRRYDCHIDNPHGGSGNYPDNGMRLTMLYYINPHWDPSGDNGGGVDIYLTDASKVPVSSNEAKKAPKLRVAPHSDTLVLLLSERMAHHVVQTKGQNRWYCLSLWCFDPKVLESVQQRWSNMTGPANDDSNSSGSDVD